LHSVYDLFISDVFQDNTNVWILGKSPMNSTELQIMLLNYPDWDIAATLYEGFLCGFQIHYSCPRTAVDSKIYRLQSFSQLMPLFRVSELKKLHDQRVNI
jgi:hypothetical protein